MFGSQLVKISLGSIGRCVLVLGVVLVGGGVAMLEEVCHWGWTLKFQKPTLFLLFSASYLWISMWALSCCSSHLLPYLTLRPQPSGTISQINLFHL